MGTVNIEDKLYYEKTTVQYQKTDYEHKKKKKRGFSWKGRGSRKEDTKA